MIFDLLSNGFIRNIFFFGVACLLFLFVKWTLPDILASIRARNAFLKGRSNVRGIVLLVLELIILGSMGYCLYDCWIYGDYIALLTSDWPYLVLGAFCVLVFLYLYKDYFSVEQLKAQFQPIKEAFEKIAQEMDELSKATDALGNANDAIKSYLEAGKDDYGWEDIEAQKETYNVYKAFFGCWDKYDPDESQDRQSREYKRMIVETKAIAENAVQELKNQVVDLFDNYQKIFYQNAADPSQRRNLPDSAVLANLARSNVLEFASLVSQIAVRLKIDKTKTITDGVQDDGMPWKVYTVCLYGFRSSNATEVMKPDCDARLKDFIKPLGFIDDLTGIGTEVRNYAQELRVKGDEIRNLAQSQDFEILTTPDRWSSKRLRALLKKQRGILFQQEKTTPQAKNYLESLRICVEALRATAHKLATELLFARLRLIGKQAERWALGFEETLELCQGLRRENLLDYERIFDVERGYEIQNKALTSSDPILKKYRTIIEHFTPDRFFNIELPFPMNSSDRQSLETPVERLTKTLKDGLKNWRTATFNLMKKISEQNPDLIVARCASYVGYQPGSSETIVVIKPVVDRRNTKLINGGQIPRPQMDDSDMENSYNPCLELNSPRSQSDGLVELAYVVLRLTITQNKLKKIAGFSGPFTDPNKISRDSPFYRPHDWKPGTPNGRYVRIGMTRGSNNGFNKGYSQGNSQGYGSSGSSSWGTNESWSEGTSEGTSESEYWVADFNVDPNFSSLTRNEQTILNTTIEDLVTQILHEGDLGINQDYEANVVRNRKRYE